MNQYVGTKSRKFIGGWGDAPTNVSLQNCSSTAHARNRSVAATAGCGGISYRQGDSRNTKKFL
jgi:hypothetical protein